MTVSGIVHVTRVWQKWLKDILTDPLHALIFEAPTKMACLGFEFGEPIRRVTDFSPPQSYDECEPPITKKMNLQDCSPALVNGPHMVRTELTEQH